MSTSAAHILYVCLYLGAIILANLSAAWFGPWATPVNAFLFIGLNITGRDRLHDAWQRRGLVWKMATLIVAGSLLTVTLNCGAGRIALASCASFVLASSLDTVTYALLGDRAQLVRVNGSNVVSAAADSVVFPWIAFGGFAPWVTLAQFGAKALGGWLWSLVLMTQSEEAP